ncbi:hypothetical protein QBC46DRAFT_414150 [Diplogelasinospora grovesii]|uniref:ABM domain-containing protein n=1 Tax=Diplogelasinospora grovesii TaxID=303347 RepID=A0AAN6MX85_9PEZI|nr:hypothetical protein QBC46DRAFT_414150 [Diplogelasinospora grovesii]
MPLHFVAMMYPKPDRVARVEEIAQSLCEYVKANEPGVLQYQWFKVSGAEQPTIVVYETYADQAAVDTHKASPKFAWLMEVSQKEDNFVAPVKLLPLEEFAGWESRA